MEIKNKPVLCPKCGNYYPAAHNTCPVCGTVNPDAAPFPGGDGLDATAFDETQPPYSDGGSFGKTESPYSNTDNSPFGPTVFAGDLGVNGGTEPVVGWLVCIDGPVRGNDYRLHTGYNYIGRETGDVRISGDQQISRQNHAMIAFDETDLIYYVGPSAGRNIIKVNGKAVINAVELHSYDVISIGTTKLIFVALCGEHFSWKKG